MKKYKLILPSNDGHSGDTFRELAKLWDEKGYVDLVMDNTSNCWLNGVNDVLLYDKPTLQWFNPNRDVYKFALFGNTVPKLPNSSPWIFWGRRPTLMEEIKKNRKGWDDRHIESIFLGKVENPIQLKKRSSLRWSDVIEKFEMPISQGYPIVEYKYTQKEYLELFLF